MSPARRLATIVAVGLATGALTQLGQGILPGDWSQAANANVPIAESRTHSGRINTECMLCRRSPRMNTVWFWGSKSPRNGK